VGQDGVTATPLGIAALLAAAVEGGQTPAPRLSQARPVERTRLLSSEQAARIREGLAEVVSLGTARAAFAGNPRRDRIVGKTGSAQRIDGHGLQRTDAWFAGAVLPPEGLDESSVIIVVSLPGGGLGGRHAASLADTISRRIGDQRRW
jgi:cell division protein FtsI/penicillin-binding protein 2